MRQLVAYTFTCLYINTMVSKVTDDRVQYVVMKFIKVVEYTEE